MRFAGTLRGNREWTLINTNRTFSHRWTRIDAGAGLR
jgi:hypothetical protein